MPQRFANDLDPSYYRTKDYASQWKETDSNLGLFFLGAGIGFAAAMLFTPKSGTEIRGQFNDFGGEIFDRLRGYWDRFGKEFSEYVPEEVQNTVSNAFDQARSKAEEFTDYAKEQAENMAGSRFAGRRDIADLLNNASKDELVSVKGIGPVLADRIIRHRPYQSEREVIAQDLLPRNVFEALKRELLSNAA